MVWPPLEICFAWFFGLRTLLMPRLRFTYSYLV
jgi:hypothetical protein